MREEKFSKLSWLQNRHKKIFNSAHNKNCLYESFCVFFSKYRNMCAYDDKNIFVKK